MNVGATDDERARTELRDSEARWRALAAALPHGMAYQVHVSADRKTRRFTYIGDSCAALNGGVTAAQALADSEALYGLIAKESRRALHEAETRSLETLTPFDVEALFEMPDGSHRWNRLTSSPRRLADGSTLWEGFQIDITDRRRAEHALRQSQGRLAMAVDLAGLGLWDYDLASEGLSWDARMRGFYGLGEDEPLDFERFVGLLHPQDRDLVLSGYEKALKAGGGDFSFEHRLVRANGEERWLLANGRVLTGPDGKPALVQGASLDITDRKRAEARTVLLLDELNHRVKNSFATVVSLLKLRAKRVKGAEAREQLGDAVNQVMSIAGAYAHLYAGGQPRSLDFADYLRALCEGLSQGMTDGERIRLEVSAHAVTMETDRALPLGMAVNELVTNAIKYAFPEGRDGRIAVDFEAGPEGGWRLSVHDDGVGLPADYARERGAGAGLVKAFAQQARAKLTVSAGPGTRFEFELEP